MRHIFSALTGEPLPRKDFPKRDWVPDNELSRTLQQGDVILVRAGGEKKPAWTTGVITEFTSSPYTHSEVHLIDGYDVSAGGTGVTYVDIHEYENYVDVLRLKESLTREERLIIFAKAAQSVLKPYAYANLVFFPTMTKKAAIRKSGNNAYMCSELVAWMYEEAGRPLIGSKPTAITAPADIGYSKALQYIGTFHHGKKIEAELNVYLPGDNLKKGDRMANFLKKISTRDEFYDALNANREKMNA